MIRALGPLGYLALMLGSVGVVLAMLTLAFLAARKSGVVKVVSVLCLLAAGGSLVLGALGYGLGMVGVMASLPNSPFDQKAELLLRLLISTSSLFTRLKNRRRFW